MSVIPTDTNFSDEQMQRLSRNMLRIRRVEEQIGKDSRAVLLEGHQIIHRIDLSLDTRRNQAGEQAADIGAEVVVIEQRVFALTNDQFQGALGRVVLQGRARDT